VKSGTGLWGFVKEFQGASWQLGRSLGLLLDSDLFGQKCFRAARAFYFYRDPRKRERALDDFVCLLYVIRDILPFLKPEWQETATLRVAGLWITKQIEAIEKAIEKAKAEDLEVLERLREEGTVSSLRKVLDEGVRSEEVKSFAELYDRFGAFPGIEPLLVLLS